MITIPDRITPLIQRIEAGETLSREDVNRVRQLQAFDLAVYGQKVAERHFQAEEELTTRLEEASQ